MKNLLVIILLLFTLTAAAQNEGRGMRALSEVQLPKGEVMLYDESHALLLGESDYTHGWSDLPGVQRDINSVEAALEKHGFSVHKHLNLTSVEIENVLNDFVYQYGQKPDNRLLIYYSGHGYTFKKSWGGEIGCIVPVDAPDPSKKLAEFEKKSINMETMQILAKEINSKHVLFMFDCCFSGNMFNLLRDAPAAITAKTKEPIRLFITAGSEDEKVPDKSIFCEEFVRALNGETPDGNRDGYLTGQELGMILQDNVRNYSHNMQNPQYGKIRNPYLDKGDFVFILNQEDVIETTSIVDSNNPNPYIIRQKGSLEITTELEGVLWVNGDRVGEIVPGDIIQYKHNNSLNVGITKVVLEYDDGHKINKNVRIEADKTSKLLIPAPHDHTYCPPTVTDIDGNTYPTVKIGRQCWMQENLKVTHYPNGDPIPYITDNDEWAALKNNNTDDAYCYYDNNTNSEYGALYTYAAAIGDNWQRDKSEGQGICPDGWHLPSDEEWKVLEGTVDTDYPVGDPVWDDIGDRGYDAGTHMKSIRGWYNNGNGDNSSGFTALPGRYRSGSNGTFSNAGGFGYWWSASEGSSDGAWYRGLSYNNANVYRNNGVKSLGLSVRCLRDE